LCPIVASAFLFAAGARLRRGQWRASLVAVAVTSLTAWAVLGHTSSEPLPLFAVLTAALAIGAVVTALLPCWNAAGHIVFMAIGASIAAFL
jgi:hypothetical protein